MDVVAACSGFLYALSMADAQIRAGRAKKALVVGSEILLLRSSTTPTGRPASCSGTARGRRSSPSATTGDGILSCHLQSDGNLWELIQIPGPGTVNPLTPDLISQKLHLPADVGKRDLQARRDQDGRRGPEDRSPTRGTAIDDVALLVPHQANQRIISAVGKRLGHRRRNGYSSTSSSTGTRRRRRSRSPSRRRRRRGGSARATSCSWWRSAPA